MELLSLFDNRTYTINVNNVQTPYKVDFTGPFMIIIKDHVFYTYSVKRQENNLFPDKLISRGNERPVYASMQTLLKILGADAKIQNKPFQDIKLKRDINTNELLLQIGSCESTEIVRGIAQYNPHDEFELYVCTDYLFIERRVAATAEYVYYVINDGILKKVETIANAAPATRSHRYVYFYCRKTGSYYRLEKSGRLVKELTLKKGTRSNILVPYGNYVEVHGDYILHPDLTLTIQGGSPNVSMSIVDVEAIDAYNRECI